MKFFTRYRKFHSKEKQRPLSCQGYDAAIRRMIIMRINCLAFFIMVTIMNVCASVHAQSITLSFRNAPLKSVLTEINKQTGFDLWYNNKHLSKSNAVTINVKNSSLKAVLDICFQDQPLSYEIIQKTIVIKPKAKPATLFERINDYIKSLRVTGIVTDDKGEPLVGASVAVKGTNQSAMTNAQGVFVLNNVNEGAVLRISFMGFETIEVKAKENITISLTRSISKLDEVQVIAYGTTTRRLSTGSISSVKAADIEGQPVSNPLAALQGRIPGLVISQTSGVPGSSFNIQIRGQSALDLTLSQNNPLIIIDGVPFEAGSGATNQLSNAANNPTSISSNGLSALNSINPQDIESVDVLKDADATSIYGSRGANGVILITTKKGKPGKTNINVNLNSGFSKVGRTMEMMNTQQYLSMRKEAFANDGLVPSANASNGGYAPDIMLWDTTRYTDFKKLLIGNTANTTNLQASVSGGTELTQFRIGANYHRETTVYPGDYADNIASVNFNVNHSTANKRFTVQLTGSYSSDKNNLPKTDLTRYINQPPNLRLYDDAGNLSWSEAGVEYASFGNIYNPLTVLQQSYKSLNENLSGNMNLGFVLVKGLSLKANLGYNTFNTNEVALRPTTAISPTAASQSGELPSSSFATSTSRNWIAEPQLEYNLNNSFGKLNVIVGSTWQDKTRDNNIQNGNNYTSDLLLNSIAAAGSITARNDYSKYRYNAFFGRINYNYADKYIINLSGRRDGSSRFGPEKQWANFGAIGVAYVFSNENFIKAAIPFLSFGKFRGSYGTTGNDQIGDYKFLNLWSNTSQAYNGIPGLFPASLFNPGYNWEINKKFEVAIDLGFLNDNILVSAAYYRNRSNNQLIRYILPTQTAFGSIIKNFPGLVQNVGWEFTISTKNIQIKDFNWTTAFNISAPKNKLLAFPGLSTSSYKERVAIGKSLSILRGLNYLGVDPQTGLYTFEDLDKDGQIATSDLQFFGDIDPRFYGGLQNNITFKGFDLAFFFQFTKQAGTSYISQLASSWPGSIMNQPIIALNRWQKEGDLSEVQKFSQVFSLGSAAFTSSNLSLSNGNYTDASFIRLKNVSLAYSIPQKLTQHLRLSRCRIYAEAQNLLTITNYKGGDPENQNYYMLPPLKSLVLGIQLNF